MTIENGGEQPANDTTVADQNAAAPVADEVDDTAVDETELDDDGNPVTREPETVELEWDGKKWVLPKDAVENLKPALLRQQDYTRKTQEVADAKRALEGEQEAFKQRSTVTAEVRDGHIKVGVLDSQLANYDQHIQAAFQSGDQARANELTFYRNQLQSQRDTAARDLSTKEQESQQATERESANRNQRAVAEIAKLVEGWTPGNEVDQKLAAFGTSRGYSSQEMLQLVTLNPKVARDLNRLRILEDAAAKQKTKQTFEQSQQAKPVPRVGGNGGSATRRTDNPSGDTLSAEEWSRREDERLEAKRKAQGRR